MAARGRAVAKLWTEHLHCRVQIGLLGQLSLMDARLLTPSGLPCPDQADLLAATTNSQRGYARKSREYKRFVQTWIYLLAFNPLPPLTDNLIQKWPQNLPCPAGRSEAYLPTFTHFVHVFLRYISHSTTAVSLCHLRHGRPRFGQRKGRKRFAFSAASCAPSIATSERR